MEEWRKELFASKETIQYAMYMKAKQDTQNKTKSINQLLKETSREKLINDYYLTQVKRRKNVPTISKDILRKVKNKKMASLPALFFVFIRFIILYLYVDTSFYVTC